VRIEFSSDLFEEVHIRPQQEPERGFLIGIQRGSNVRILLARRNPDDNGPRGTGRIGIFISRPRGEVFLTDDDLGFMHDHQADIALVMVGCRAGFFVRERDGSLQAVRSHQEFQIHPEPAVGQDGILRAIANRAGRLSLKPD
jgi:hypothetical protein